MPHELSSQMEKIIELLSIIVVGGYPNPAPCIIPVAEPIPEEDKMLTKKETANLFEVSHRTISRWQADKLIEAKYIGGNIYFSRAELKESVKKNKLNKK